MYRITIHLALGLLTLLTLAACGIAAQSVAGPSADPKLGQHAPLLTIRAEGGHCVTGGCWSEQQINVDGTFTATDSTGATKSGTVDAVTVAELTQQIAVTNFAELKAQPFTGTCPIVFDGQEYSYTFQTLSGPQTIASCQVEIDENSPLFQTIAGLIEVMNQE
jgi:hypothetical protein